MTKKEKSKYKKLSLEITKLEDVPLGLIEAIIENNNEFDIEYDESEYTNFKMLCNYHIYEIASDVTETIDSDYIFKEYIGRLGKYVIITNGSQYRKDGGLCELEMELGFNLYVIG